MNNGIKAVFFLKGQKYSIKMIHHIPRIGEEVLFINDILCKVDIVVHNYTEDENIVNIGLSLTCRNTETMEQAEIRLSNQLSIRNKSTVSESR